MLPTVKQLTFLSVLPTWEIILLYARQKTVLSSIHVISITPWNILLRVYTSGVVDQTSMPWLSQLKIIFNFLDLRSLVLVRVHNFLRSDPQIPTLKVKDGKAFVKSDKLLENKIKPVNYIIRMSIILFLSLLLTMFYILSLKYEYCYVHVTSLVNIKHEYFKLWI